MGRRRRAVWAVAFGWVVIGGLLVELAVLARPAGGAAARPRSLDEGRGR